MEPRYQGRGVVVLVAWEALHQRRRHPRHRCCQLGYLECKLQAASLYLHVAVLTGLGLVVLPALRKIETTRPP